MLLPFSIEPLIDFPLIDLPLIDLPLIDLPFAVTTSRPRARAESSFAALPPQAATSTAAAQAIARGPLIRTNPEAIFFLADILCAPFQASRITRRIQTHSRRGGGRSASVKLPARDLDLDRHDFDTRMSVLDLVNHGKSGDRASRRPAALPGIEILLRPKEIPGPHRVWRARPVVRRAVLRVRAAYIACCVLWGSSWMMIKIGLRDLPPFLFAGSRMILASAVLLPFAIRAGLRGYGRRTW